MSSASSAQAPAIETQQLTKYYGSAMGIEELDITVYEGEVFGFLGPNGPGKTYTVKYFERAVFEMHPEFAAPNDVLLSLLGNFLYGQKYPNGAPNQKVSADNPRKFNETGKTMGGKFRAYWEKNGGLAQQGFPISEEFQERNDLDGKVYTVQYFERAVFEIHPENAGTQFEVLLSQLGTFRYRAKYGQAQVTPSPSRAPATATRVPPSPTRPAPTAPPRPVESPTP